MTFDLRQTLRGSDPHVKAVASFLHGPYAATKSGRCLEHQDGMIGSSNFERSRHTASTASNDNDVIVRHVPLLLLDFAASRMPR